MSQLQVFSGKVLLRSWSLFYRNPIIKVKTAKVERCRTYHAHALISLRIQDAGLLDWLNAILKNGFDRTAGDRVTFCGCICFEPSFARYLPSSLESRTRSQIRFFVRNSLGLDSRWLVREYSQPLALCTLRIRSPVMGSRIVVFNLSLAVARWNPSFCDSPRQSRKVRLSVLPDASV